MRKIMNKRGDVLKQHLIEIVLSGILIALFLFATYQKSSSNNVKQQVIEKQMALLIASASPGMSFSMNKVNFNGVINDIRIERGRVFADVNGFRSIKGYPYVSRYNVFVKEENDKFIIEIRE